MRRESKSEYMPGELSSEEARDIVDKLKDTRLTFNEETQCFELKLGSEKKIFTLTKEIDIEGKPVPISSFFDSILSR